MQIRFPDGAFDVDDAYSRKDFTGYAAVSIPDGIIIYMSCFSQETPDSEIFRADMTGVTFRNCNLDNVVVPPGNRAIDCSQRRFKVQNDLRDWELDAADQPAAVINEKYWLQQGLSVDPANIPAAFIRREELSKADYVAQAEEQLTWFTEAPTVTESEPIPLTLTLTAEQWQAMQEARDYRPFDERPQETTVAQAGGSTDVTLSGFVTRVTVEGPGLLEKDGQTRRFDTEAADLLIPAKADAAVDPLAGTK